MINDEHVRQISDIELNRWYRELDEASGKRFQQLIADRGNQFWLSDGMMESKFIPKDLALRYLSGSNCYGFLNSKLHGGTVWTVMLTPLCRLKFQSIAPQAAFDLFEITETLAEEPAPTPAKKSRSL